MSRIEKLAIRGIRSFDPQEEVKIEFFRPLTLIQGHNGSGKTTIIECLKMASCGSLPPLATNGKTFICDPKINGSTESKASIKLKFLTPRDKEVLIIRNFQLCIKSNKYEFKRLEQLLKSYNSVGELVTINSTCIDIDKQVPLLMHSSKAILENVIFCHQEETNWPFTEAGNLKKVFDEIFDTAKYTKALEDLKDINKQYVSKSKDLKIKIELIQKDFEQYKKINLHLDANRLKIEEINKIIEDLSENINKGNKDYKQILEYEEQFRHKENEINLTKMRIEEKTKQIQTMKSDPFFQDYTQNEETYQNFLASFQIYFNSQKNESSEQRIHNIKCNLERFNSDYRNLNDEINTIDANIISKNQIFTSILQNKKLIIEGINKIESIELSINFSDSYPFILEYLTNRELTIKEKLNIMDDKKRSFELKLNEKLNDNEIYKVLIESKKKEIDQLEIKKTELSKLISNMNNNSNLLNEINYKIIKINEEINSVSCDENFNDKMIELESNKENLTSEMNKFIHNDKSIIYDINKIKEYSQKYLKLETIINEKIINFNKTFNTNFPIQPNYLLSSLEEIIKFIRIKKEEITEEKQKIREENCVISTQIEMCEKQINRLNQDIENSIRNQKNLFNEIKYLFDLLNIPLESNELDGALETKFNCVTSEITKILIYKNELNTFLENLNSDRTTRLFEIKFLEEHLCYFNNEKRCSLCGRSANLNEVDSACKLLKIKINELHQTVNNLNETIVEKSKLLEIINNTDSKLINVNKFDDENKKILLILNDIEKDLNNYYAKRRNFENNSKEKSRIIYQLEKFFGEPCNSNEVIYKIQNDYVEVQNIILRLGEKLNLKCLNGNSCSVSSVINRNIMNSEIDQITDCLQKFNSLEMQLNITCKDIQELQIFKSHSLEKLNILNAELRTTEMEKSKLSKFADSNEIFNKIMEIDTEIINKQKEKENLELEFNKLSDVKNILLSKKIEFENIYNDKNYKYKTLLDKLNLFKIKIECAMYDLEKILNDSYSMDSELNLSNSIEEIFNSQLASLKVDKDSKENRKRLVNEEIQKLSEEINLKENEIRKFSIKENLYKNNLLLYSLNAELRVAYDFLSKNESKIAINSKIYSAKEKINEKLNVLNSQYNLNLGKLQELDNNLSKLNFEIKNDVYYEIEKRYNKLKVEYILSIETSKQVESYYEAVDQSLLKYHAKRMEEINKLINYYWNMTYRGSDMKWIEIRSDVEKTARSRSYNYRIVYGTTDDHELDMRGRCSAGQKVLASIIIRLALAETFCNNCGILCLDEPTTNLDDNHIKSLAKALREIIQSRTDDQNFQLIVITHDPTFVDLIGSDCCDSFWYVSKNERRFSKLELKPINSIFNN